MTLRCCFACATCDGKLCNCSWEDARPLRISSLKTPRHTNKYGEPWHESRSFGYRAAWYCNQATRLTFATLGRQLRDTAWELGRRSTSFGECYLQKTPRCVSVRRLSKYVRKHIGVKSASSLGRQHAVVARHPVRQDVIDRSRLHCAVAAAVEQERATL